MPPLFRVIHYANSYLSSYARFSLSVKWLYIHCLATKAIFLITKQNWSDVNFDIKYYKNIMNMKGEMDANKDDHNGAIPEHHAATIRRFRLHKH